MPRLLLPCLALLLLAACTTGAPVPPGKPMPQHAAPAPEAAATPVERAFPQDSLYPLLVAEFALRRRAYDVALDQYLLQAPLLRDVGVSEHTTHLAQFMNREQEALEAVQLWVELAPDDTEANNTLAILLVRQGRAHEALPHFALLARQGKRPNFTVLLTGFTELDATRRAELITAIDALAVEFPDDTQLLLTQAMIAAEYERFDRALAALDRIFALEPDQEQAALLEARILVNRNADRPYVRIERVLKADPGNKALRLQYARLLTATDIAAARKQFEILSAQSPRDGDLLLSLALINRETGDALAAKAYLRQLLALEQRTDEAHYYLGRIAEEEGDMPGAIYEYRQVEDGREFLVATSRAGALLLEAGQLEENQAMFARLRADYPDRREQLYGMEADLLMRAGELDTAGALLDQAVAELPASTAVRYTRSLLWEEQGDLARMESDLRQIIADEPNNATALNALGYTLANRTERYQEAYELIAKALALEPGQPAILDSMGWVLYRLNRNDEAVAYLSRAYAAFPDPEVAAHLGEVLWVSGKTSAATTVWRGALLKDPDNRVIAETLDRLGVAALVDNALDDTATPDARTPDARTPDARTPDARTPDARTPDAPAPDAPTPDAGTPGTP